MRAVIDRKAIDLKKAEVIGSCGYRSGRDRAYDFDETLYKTKDGKWILDGSGGSFTMYRSDVDPDDFENEVRFGPGEGMFTLSNREAFTWCMSLGGISIAVIDKLFPRFCREFRIEKTQADIKAKKKKK